MIMPVAKSEVHILVLFLPIPRFLLVIALIASLGPAFFRVMVC